MYDPCPVGWRVPDASDNDIWPDASGTYDDTNKGIDFSGKFGGSSTIWYPASGKRFCEDGQVLVTGMIGYFWSAIPLGSNAGSLLFLDMGIGGYVNGPRAAGYAVRCLKE